jgi:hypothetical protein
MIRLFADDRCPTRFAVFVTPSELLTGTCPALSPDFELDDFSQASAS